MLKGGGMLFLLFIMSIIIFVKHNQMYLFLRMSAVLKPKEGSSNDGMLGEVLGPE